MSSPLRLLVPFVGGLSLLHGCQAGPGRAHQVDEQTIVAEASFLAGHPAVNPDGSVNVVVEIPAGTTAKWEVDKADGALRWEIKDGRPRVVRYLGYPGNYGMVPRTMLPEEHGGDGDPLDVLVLGDALARGSVVAVRLLGVLELLDGGEQDDKLIAVVEGTPLAEAGDVDELEALFPGVRSIVETWFEGYKGPGEIEASGYAGPARAHEILDAACTAFDERAGLLQP